jgi:DNA replication protein DnaC
MLNEPTIEKLRSMRLLAMAEAWLAQQRSTEVSALDFDERFGLLVDAEYMRRENRSFTRRLSEAKLRHGNACIEDFDDPVSRGLDKATVRKLATCRWIDEHLNVVITGPTGVGKTYLACALGQQACRKGHRVLYRRTPRLIDELTLARADGSLTRLLARLARVDLLVLDDWGLTPLRDQDRRDLLEVVEDRDGTRSTLIASQIPVDSGTTISATPLSPTPSLTASCTPPTASPSQGPPAERTARSTLPPPTEHLTSVALLRHVITMPDPRDHDAPI